MGKTKTKAEKGFAIRCPHCQQWSKWENTFPEEVALDSKEELKNILNILTYASACELEDNALFSSFSHKKLFRCQSPQWVCPTSFEAFICRSKDNVLDFLNIDKPSSLTRSFELYKIDCETRWEGYYGVLFCTQPIPRLKFTELDQLMERELLRRLILGVGYEIKAPVTFYALNFFEKEAGKPLEYWMPIESYSRKGKWVPPRYNPLCRVCRELVTGRLIKKFEKEKRSVENCPAFEFGKIGGEKKCANRDAACMQEPKDWNHCPAFIEQRKELCPCYHSDHEAIKEVKKKWEDNGSKAVVEYQCYLGFSEAAFPVVVYDHLVGVVITGQNLQNSQEIVDIEDFVDGKSKFDKRGKPWEFLQNRVEEIEEAKNKLLSKRSIRQKKPSATDALNKNIKRIKNTAEARYRDHRGKSEAAFREEILTFIRTYKEEDDFFDKRIQQVLEKMWKFWAFHGAYFGRYSQKTEEISAVAYSTVYGDKKTFGLPGKKLGSAKLDRTEIHPCKYIYRKGRDYSGENPFLKKFIPIFEEAMKDSDLRVPEGECYYIVVISFIDEVYVFAFTVRNEKALLLPPSLDPAGVSELGQDEILETCVRTAYEFRENRIVVEKRAELDFTKKLGNLVHTNSNRLFSTIGNLELILKNYKGEFERELGDSLDNTLRTNGSLHAVDILSKYMESKTGGEQTYLDQLKMEPTDFHEVLDYLKSETALRSMADTWVGSLEIVEPTEAEITIEIDTWVIYELLYCIVDNAIKHGPKTKDKKDNEVKITVSTAIDSENGKSTLIIKVSDTGRGVEKEINDTINIYLSSGVLNEWPQQIGYGLLMAKCGVELHKGTILFSSKLNKGTTVEIQLPITI